MKRTRLQRHTPLQRGKPLKRKTALKATGKRSRKTLSKKEVARRRKERKHIRELENPKSDYWEREAKKIWRPAVVLLCGNKCAVCGRTEPEIKLEGAHLISRERRLTRWHPFNGMILCHKHHRTDKALSSHYGAAGFYAWLQEHWPERMKWLQIMRPLLDQDVALQSYSYAEQYELSQAIITERRDYLWLCARLGLSP